MVERRSSAPLLAVVALSACGGSVAEPDAAPDRDARPSDDASLVDDASVPVEDASAIDDAGGLALDAGASTDAPMTASDGGAPLTLTCADIDGVEVCSGVLDPTTLGPGVEPVPTGRIAGAPGSHWFCRPGDPSAWTGTLLVHVVGTYSDPADDHRFPERACALGHVAIAPMYENRDDVRSTCAEDAACYEGFHVEVVDGVDRSPVDVDADDALVARAQGLLDALALGDASFPGWASLATELRADDWPDTFVSGHSQGAGHALYLAREHALARLVLLAGPSDQLRDGQPDHAPPPWITSLAGVSATPVERFHAFIHLDDSLERVAQVFASYDVMGLGTACDFADAGGYAADCRRVLIASDGCLGLSAHVTVVSRTWGAACRIGGSGHESAATWAFLLR